MAKHEFGIMETPPEAHTRYDEYEPHKYNCISVDDEYVEEAERDFCRIDLYWHTLDVPGKGLAYCGVTLIPPETLDDFMKVIRNKDGLSELENLCIKAKTEYKWIIHYGL